MNLGAHLSVAGGLHRAFERAREETATALQIFTRNQRQWRAVALPSESCARFREARAESAVQGVLAHASYLINLASPDEDLRERSLRALSLEYRRAEALGIDALIFHPGAHMGSGIEAGLRRIAAGVRIVLDETPGYRCRLVFENTAGAGTQIGSRFEEIARLLAVSGPLDRTGVCLDTCHLHVAGYDLRDPSRYRRLRRECDSIIGLSRVVALHLNDAAAELGSHLDRHAHIGRGAIGLDGFRALMRDDRFAEVPKVIETPKGRNGRRSWDRVNLARLRSLQGDGRAGPGHSSRLGRGRATARGA
jgi:deoxyribonuclease-4